LDSTRQFNLRLKSLTTKTENEPSASISPVQNHGLIIFPALSSDAGPVEICTLFKVENDDIFNCLEGILI
jgi:hypothetical protein